MRGVVVTKMVQSISSFSQILCGVIYQVFFLEGVGGGGVGWGGGVVGVGVGWVGGGGGGGLRLWSPSTMWVGPSIYLWPLPENYYPYL